MKGGRGDKALQHERALRRAKERELALTTIQRDQMKRDLEEAARRISDLRTQLTVAGGGAPPRIILAGPDVVEIGRVMVANGYHRAIVRTNGADEVMGLELEP